MIRAMRKFKAPPKVTRHDARTGDQFIREWIQHIGSVLAAEREAQLYRGHLHTWLGDPGRRFNPESQRKLARVAGLPIEALQFRFEPIGKLDMWKWLKAFK